MENNWFNEGFNDHIAIYNLVKTGLYSKADFLDYVNGGNLASQCSSQVGQKQAIPLKVTFSKTDCTKGYHTSADSFLPFICTTSCGWLLKGKIQSATFSGRLKHTQIL
ncbi:hypothetical protein [Pedobacter sp. MC2016-15]|uniref:hypothetical protein n=1 Tax=Pedobacter sp. MC2016-15 TaxID=2994473 RepID=UPI002245DE95|nr:hypothetical protein [Pedobacter sp. MC2016-15]